MSKRSVEEKPSKSKKEKTFDLNLAAVDPNLAAAVPVQNIVGVDPNPRRRKAAEKADAKQAYAEEAALKKGRPKETVVPNLPAAVSSSDKKSVSKSKKVKDVEQKVKDVEQSLPAAASAKETPKQLEEDAYNGILKGTVTPARPVIHGVPDLLIEKYSATSLPADDEVAQEVRAINLATRRNQLAIQSTFGHESWEYNLLKLPPRIIKKSGKQEVVETAYDQTVRMQTLEEISILDESTGTIRPVQKPENLLKIQDMPIKSTIAFQQEDNNPNGVLSVALTKALKYLVSNTKQGERFELTAKVSDDITMRVELPKCIQTIEEIKNASRGAKSKEDKDLTFKVFSNSLLKAFYDKVINGGINSEDKMKTIIGVYGSFLNKGLSDTAQGGELIKVWLLKFMEKFKNGRVQLRAKRQGELEYWDATCGIPYLKLISSDKIASALYIRLINLFRGGMTSIQPYKAGGGESSVFYLPKKYVGLIIAMTTEDERKLRFSIDRQAIIKNAKDIKNKFYDKCLQTIQYLNKSDFDNTIFKMNEIIQCLYGLIDNSDYMNIYDIIEAINENQNAIIKYLNTCYTHPYVPDPRLLPPYMQQNINCIYLLFRTSGGLYDTRAKRNLKEDFNIRISNLYNIINCFGTFIQELSEYVRDNEDELESLFNAYPDHLYENSQAFSMIAETVGYYDNCMFLRSLSPDQCVEKYLEVCQEEVLCAFADVNYGHDQDINHDVLQRLGEQFMLILCNGDPAQLPEFMEIIRGRYDINEDQISKIILDVANFVSICQTTNNNIIFQNTTDYKLDFINNHRYVRSFINFFKIGAACGTILISIDFYVGKPPEIGSKTYLYNEFNEFDKLLYFILNPREREIQTTSTFADLAAPPGCVFASVGNMAISYKTFRFQDKITGEISQYIYEISTFDLGGNKTTNTNEFRIGQCLAKNTGQQFTQIFTADELQRYRPITEEQVKLYTQLQQFSRNLSKIVNTANKTDSFFEEIEDAIRTNPKLRDKTSEFFLSLLKFIDTITGLTNELENLKRQPRSATRQKELNAEIKRIRVETLEGLKDLLNERYIEIYKALAEIIPELEETQKQEDIIRKQGQPIPQEITEKIAEITKKITEITEEITDITTFLEIVNGFPSITKQTFSKVTSTELQFPVTTFVDEMATSMSPKASASSPKKLSGQASTLLWNLGRGEEVVGFGDPRAETLLRTPDTMKRGYSISSASSVETLTGASVPYWYYLLTTETPAKGWFIQQLSQRGYDVERILNDYDKDTLLEDVENEICEVMAVIFCDNISKKVKTAPGDLTIYNECKKTYKRVFSGNYSKNSSADNTTRGILKYIQKATAMETNAGGAKRTRKHKLNKNRRKTKHINKFNRKRKTKRLIKNKRRLTKKR